MTSVVEINDAEQLANCRLLWQSLLARTRRASYFQSLDWLEVYWRHYGAAQQLRVLVVESTGQAIGILPLVVRSERTRLGELRVLTYPLDDWGTFYGPIGPNPTATLLAGLGHVRRTARDWDLIELRWVNGAAVDAGRTPQAMCAKRIPAVCSSRSKCAQIALDGTWEKYWSTRKPEWRSNVRRIERRLSERGAVEHVRYRPLGTAHGDDDPRWDLFDECQRLAAASWQGDSQAGTTMSHETVREFLRDARLAATRAGALDMNLLTVGGRPVAFNYCYHYQGLVFGLRMGYDQALAREGAGSLLMARIIEDSFRRGDYLLDLGADYLEPKKPWWTHIETALRYTYYPHTPRAQLLSCKRRWADWRAQAAASRAAVGAAAK